jgi:hypothetical protein
LGEAVFIMSVPLDVRESFHARQDMAEEMHAVQ